MAIAVAEHHFAHVDHHFHHFINRVNIHFNFIRSKKSLCKFAKAFKYIFFC